MTDKIEKWIALEESKVDAMIFWIEGSMKRKQVSERYLTDGPYPIMIKLIELVRLYRNACDKAGVLVDTNVEKLAKKVISK